MSTPNAESGSGSASTTAATGSTIVGSSAFCDARVSLVRARQAAPNTTLLAPAAPEKVRSIIDDTVSSLQDIVRSAPPALQPDLQRELDLQKRVGPLVIDAWGRDGVGLTNRARDAGNFDPFAYALRDGIPSEAGPTTSFGDFNHLRAENGFKAAVACGALSEQKPDPSPPPPGRLVYQKLDSKRLASIRTDGSNPSEVTVVDGATAARDIAVSPDGRHLSYTATVDKRSTLFVADIDGSNARAIDAHGDPACPSWSPDSTTLLVGRGRPHDSIRTVTLEGVVSEVPVETGDYSCAVFLSSAVIVYERAASDENRVELWRAGLDGSSQRRFVAADGCFPGTFAISPDGRTFAFTTGCFDLARSGLYTTDQDGGNLRRVVPGLAGVLSWSPDSHYVALSFAQPQDDRTRPMVLVSAVDGARSWEVRPAGNSWPAWLPTDIA